MDYAFVMDHLEGKAHLYKKLPDLVLSQVKHAIDDTVVFVCALELGGTSSTGYTGVLSEVESLQVALQVALVTILHDQVQLVPIRNETVHVFADVAVGHLAHQLLLL